MRRTVNRINNQTEKKRKKKFDDYCINCKKYINETFKFCPNCGKKQTPDTPITPTANPDTPITPIANPDTPIIANVTPSRLRGNNPPMQFVFNDELNDSVTTFTLIQNDEYCNVYLVCLDHRLEVVDEYQILHYWKQPSEMQIGINQVNGYDERIRWVDTYVGTRVGEWEGLAMNFVRRALSHIIDERGNPLNLDEEFL